MHTIHRWLPSSCLSLLLLLVSLAHAAPEYTIIDLGADAIIQGVDPQGNAYGSLHGEATLFTPVPIPLGMLPGTTTSIARGRDGLHGTVGDSEGLAFHRLNGLLHALDPLTPDAGLGSGATALNGQVIVGSAEQSPNVSVPVVWPLRGGAPRVLPTLGGTGGDITAITTSGVMVGNSATPAGWSHATLWIFDLAFDLTPDAPRSSFATGINQDLVIVGALDRHAWRWTPQHGSEDLGTFPGSVQASLYAVNAQGIAVGFDAPGEPSLPARAIRWNGTQLQDLNTLVRPGSWHLELARGINDAGVIAGQGRWRGQPRGFLLRPLPHRLVQR